MDKRGVEKLQSSVPVIAGTIGDIALHIDETRHITHLADTAQRGLIRLNETLGEQTEVNRMLFDQLISDVNSSEIMTDLEKYAFLGTFKSRLSNKALRGEVDTQTYFGELEENYHLSLASLKAIDRYTRQPNVPILYCQIECGETYSGNDELTEKHSVRGLYSARTTGTGLVIESDPFNGFYGGTLSFEVEHESQKTIPNFGIGYQSTIDGNPAISVLYPHLLVGTAKHAKKVVNKSLQTMQTSAIFIGDPARNVVEKFILDNIPPHHRRED